MACCLPIGIAAGVGTAGLGVAIEPLRPYLLAISGALILFGMWQLYRRGASCDRRSRTSKTSLVVFWTCAAVVALIMVAPQILAGFWRTFEKTPLTSPARGLVAAGLWYGDSGTRLQADNRRSPRWSWPRCGPTSIGPATGHA